MQTFTAPLNSMILILLFSFVYCSLSFSPNNNIKSVSRSSQYSYHESSSIRLYEMKRPILDRIASALFKLENSRVEASSEIDSKGRVGEPMEWAESTASANKVSEFIAKNPLGYRFKQFVADIIAGDFDEKEIGTTMDTFIDSNTVAMFSFTTCPFCRRAKDYLDDNNIAYKSMELDDLEGNIGNEIRAMLGRRTQRTSVPSIFINGKNIGGCNDGPGLLTLAESGELNDILSPSLDR